MESGYQQQAPEQPRRRSSANGSFQQPQQQQRRCSCILLGRGGTALVHVSTCPLAPGKLSTVTGASAIDGDVQQLMQAKHASTGGNSNKKNDVFASKVGGGGVGSGVPLTSLEDVRLALIDGCTSDDKGAEDLFLPANQIDRLLIINESPSSTPSPPPPPPPPLPADSYGKKYQQLHINDQHGRSSLSNSKSFVNDLVNRSLQSMVNLNPVNNCNNSNSNYLHSDNLSTNSDATPIMNHEEEQEPRSFEPSLEGSPEPPELEDLESTSKEMMAKKGSIGAINPVGPMEFIERYRIRNSSQRPLVGESFASDTAGSRLELKDAAEDLGMISAVDLIHHPKLTGGELGSTDDDTDDDAMPERGQWSGKLDFIFSCISYAVGLGNVWRFPYLCYENGGGAFLVPYLICVCVLGVPLFLMEVSLGQYLQAGGVSIWNRIPMLKGIGFASMVMIGLCNTYYIVIIAWTLYYLVSSFKSPLPWSHCGNPWNTAACHENDATHNGSNAVPPAMEFWNLNVLNITDDILDVGNIQWHLFATLIAAWILVYLVIYRGIHQSGKIIWFTAIFPYIILVILFGYGISLSGAKDGILFYLTPKWHMLKEAKIWVAAGTQLLFTYGIGIGTNIALGSYNTFHHNFFRDSLIACLLSSGTSLFSGFVIFSVLGHLAEGLNTTVEDVARSGPGLAFIVYPEAVTRLPAPNVWAVLFFIMLLVLGIDSQFCTVESFVTGIVDEWPRFLRPRRQLFTAFVVLMHFLLGLTMITEGGMWVFQLMDNFSASGISLLVVVLLEIVGFCWIYGASNIYDNMCKMLGFRPNIFLYYVWVFVSPACLLAILIFSIVQYTPPDYAGTVFPWYGQFLGWIISSSSIICIPLYIPYYLFFKADQSLTFKERIIAGLWPDASNDDAFTGSTSMDIEKASARELLNSHAHLAGGMHYLHEPNSGLGSGSIGNLPGGSGNGHLVSSKTPFHLLTGSNSTLATSIADTTAFAASATNINGVNGSGN